MAHGDAREGKWRGNWRMEWVASILHTTSEHGISSITTADAHTSAASSRLNWRPRRFKWTRPFRRKTRYGFCACAITFQLACTKQHGLTSQKTAFFYAHHYDLKSHMYSKFRAFGIKTTQQCAHKRNMKARSRNHCYRVKSIRMKYCDSVCVLLLYLSGMQIAYAVLYCMWPVRL
jgi:hypothetical protein